MDQHRFDDLSRIAARAHSRRKVLAAALGALLFGGASLAGTDSVGATKPLRGRPYRSTCTADRQCRTGLVCRREKSLHRLDRNRCGCASGYVYCGGSCVELGTDDHCLACGDACGQGESCCASTGVGCSSLTTIETCGDCDTACDPDLADTCDLDFGCICGDGSGACPGDDILCCDGGCVDTTDESGHCGACGNACAGSTECCDRTCTDTDTSADHCGGCGQPCDPGYGCESGTCVQLTCTPTSPNKFCGVGANGAVVQGCSAETDDDGPGVPANSSSSGTPCTVDSDCSGIYFDCGFPGQPCKCLAGAADYGASFSPFSASECYMIWETVAGSCN